MSGISTFIAAALAIVLLVAVVVSRLTSNTGGQYRPVVCEDIGNGDCMVRCPFRAVGTESGTLLVFRCN